MPPPPGQKCPTPYIMIKEDISKEDTLLSHVSKETRTLESSSSKPKTKKELPEEAKKLASLQLSKLKALFQGFKDPKDICSWAADIDKLNRIDGKSWQQIEEMICWVYEDNFWCKVILSPGKLREQFDKLLVKRAPVENKGTFLAKNKALAYEAKSAYKNSPIGNKMQVNFNEVVNLETGEKISMELPSKQFIAEMCRKFGIKWSD